MSSDLDFLPDDFDVNEEAKSGGFDGDPVPPGWYEATVERAEMKDTAAGTGKYLNLGLQLVGGQYDGRYVWDKFNLVNPSAQAQSIGRAQYAKLNQALGFHTVCRNTDLLVGKRLKIRVAVVKGLNDEPDNGVKGYKASELAPPSSQPTQSAPSATPHAKSAEPSKKNPWGK